MISPMVQPSFDEILGRVPPPPPPPPIVKSVGKKYLGLRMQLKLVFNILRLVSAELTFLLFRMH